MFEAFAFWAATFGRGLPKRDFQQDRYDVPPMLPNLLTPADLRNFTDDEMDTLAEEIRHRIRTTVTETGGHLSSNLGVVELTLALHRTFDFSPIACSGTSATKPMCTNCSPVAKIASAPSVPRADCPAFRP